MWNFFSKLFFWSVKPCPFLACHWRFWKRILSVVSLALGFLCVFWHLSEKCWKWACVFMLIQIVRSLRNLRRAFTFQFMVSSSIKTLVLLSCCVTCDSCNMFSCHLRTFMVVFKVVLSFELTRAVKIFYVTNQLLKCFLVTVVSQCVQDTQHL